MGTTVCSKCDVGWVIHSHDKHCGHCGCKVFDFAVKWEAEPLIYAGDGADIHDLTILIENTGAYPIAFQPIQTQRDNTVQFPQGNNLFEVNAGDIYRVPIQVNPTSLASYAEVITVRAQNAPPNLESKKTLQLQTLLRPEFRLTPNPVVVRYRRGTEKVTVDLHLEVLQGHFHISSIMKDSHQWIRDVQCPIGPHETDIAAKKVSLDIDFNQLNDELNTITLGFKLRGLSEPYTRQVRIQKEIEPEPQKLSVQKTNLYEVTQDREKEFTLTLQNTGELPLTIQNIAFNDSSNIVQLLNIEYPITIEGGAHHNVEVLISTEGIAPKDYPIDFTINSDCEAAPQYQDALNVRVNEREEYPHYLAIDFGTTNSCCAYIDLETYEPKLIVLDGKANPPEIMPSSIVYHSNPANGKTHHVGLDAETYRTSEIDGPYHISSVKRWLGYEWGRHFPDNQKLQPCDVVADILKHIIERAEEHLDTLTTESKITRCVVTHPTMFVRKQREDLKFAFEKVGITDLIFIDEASAASMGTISQYLEKYETFPNDYSMLVYDFGGGTIDIVLSKVKSNSNEYTIEPVARGGNLKYGGDDVTQAIVDTVLKEFGQRIQRANENLPFEIPYLRLRKILEPSGYPKIDEAARHNSATLYRVAEQMKKKLSEKIETNGFFPLSVVVGNDVRPLENLIEGAINVELSEEQLQSLIEPTLNETFANIDAMIADNGGLPDTVVLAGQSSKMPLLRRMMAAHLQGRYKKDIPINRAEDLKACVVIGAAQYSLTRRLQGIKFKIALENKTHSRLGIVRLSGVKPIFGEIIPSGRLIPEESFETTDFPLGSRMVFIDVHEHFGMDNDLTNTSRIDSYTLTLPEEVSEQALRTAQLKMAVEENGNIQVIVIVDGKKYKTNVEKKAPAFVNEI